jgi:5-(carboxyamino)imidazole ribonucleotide synthase
MTPDLTGRYGAHCMPDNSDTPDTSDTRAATAPRPGGGPTIGIVGGGQLARMMLTVASELAIDARLLATTTDESGPGAWPHTTTVDALDDESLGAFARDCDVITFDHELVDSATLEALEHHGHVLRPGARALSFSDKSAQRSRLAAAGLPLPRFAMVVDDDDLEGFVASVGGWPVVLKPPRGGYDGRGVHIVSTIEEGRAVIAGTGGPVVAEELLDIEIELAVLVVTRASGDQVTYPVVQTVQVDGICHQVIHPAPIDDHIAAEARRIATTVADLIGAVGVLAVELFVCGGRVLVNEVAPRPHNSGHLTIEASVTSQFENHLRATLDWPLGSTEPVAPAAVMLNVIGQSGAGDPAARRHEALAVPGVHVHLYGKSWRSGRKLGHVTALGSDVATAMTAATRALNLLQGVPDST